MKRDFDFKEIGKQVPYRIPEGFFDELQQNVPSKTTKRTSPRRILLTMLPSGLAAAAVLAAVIFLPVKTHEAPNESLSQVFEKNSEWIEELSDEDLTAMDEFGYMDVFIHE